MDDSMIGRWLSELPMDDPSRKSTSKPMLRRFTHHEEPIHYHELIAVGTEGIICRVEISGNEYALKIVRLDLNFMRFGVTQYSSSAPLPLRIT